MDAIMHLVMQKMIASGKIQVPTGIPKMAMMVPGNGLKMLETVPPVKYNNPFLGDGVITYGYYPGDIRIVNGSANIDHLASSETPKMGFIVNGSIYYGENEPNLERSVATDFDKTSPADPQK